MWLINESQPGTNIQGVGTHKHQLSIRRRVPQRTLLLLCPQCPQCQLPCQWNLNFLTQLATSLHHTKMPSALLSLAHAKHPLKATKNPVLVVNAFIRNDSNCAPVCTSVMVQARQICAPVLRSMSTFQQRLKRDQCQHFSRLGD